MANYTILKKGKTHTLVEAPLNYYMCIPNEKYKEDETYLDNLWSSHSYIVDVKSLLLRIIDL